ncbi:RDD family protein [Demequina globuliformis]|uniref:RDD family protein n=1 Tax=Demequina globuliformis TaxID=676202 RepID=UPI0007841337|nr:RDD family protein [Demequina globuliformis]
MTEPREDDQLAQSSALVGRRLIGLGIDWMLCLVITSAFFAQEAYADTTGIERVLVAGDPVITMAIWAAQHLILVATLGTTIGHRVAGLRVVREDGASMVGLPKALGRTVLLALVIPAVVWDPQGRGLHDRAVGTRIVSTRAANAT